MRFDNIKSTKKIYSICFFLLILILLFILLETFHLVSTTFFYVLVGVPFIALIYIFAMANYFWYDHFGENLLFQNKKVMSRFYLKRKKHRVIFNKAKLKKYKIKDYVIYRSLKLYISLSKKQKKIEIIRFDITFLSQKKIKLLEQSLDKILITNTATA